MGFNIFQKNIVMNLATSSFSLTPAVLLTMLLSVLYLSVPAATKAWSGGSSGSWNDPSQWSPSGVPGASDDVVFGAGTTVVSFSGDGVIQSLTFNNGADVTFFPVDASADRGLNLTGANTTELVVNSGCTLTLDGFADATNPRAFVLEFKSGGTTETATIFGIINANNTGLGGKLDATNADVTFEAGSAYNHNVSGGEIPLAEFNSTSTVTVTGFIDNTTGAILNGNQEFGNFTWDCLDQIGHAQILTNSNKEPFSSTGTFTLNNTGTKTLRTSSNTGVLNLNNLVINDSAALVLRSNSGKTKTMNVSGNIVLNGGELKSKNPNTNNTSTVIVNLAGNLTQAGGLLKEEDGNSFTFNFNGSAVQDYSFTGLSALDGDIDFDVNSGATLNVLDKLRVSSGGSITNNGEIIFNNNAVFDASGTVSGTGNITLVRRFNRAGWQHISFPIKRSTTKTLGDIEKTGEAFNYTNPKSPQTNIFFWDAATSGWMIPTATTPVDKPFSIYSFGNNESVELTIDNADFNTEDFAQPYVYFDNASGPNNTTPGNSDNSFGTGGWANAVVDGWNLFANPFQAYINSASLNTDLANEADLDNGIYVWDDVSDSYQLNPTYINPNQAYFVHASAGSGNFSINTALRDSAGSGPGFFKTKNELTLNLSSDSIHLKTVLVENTAASSKYDFGLDAYYLWSFSGENATIFNSVSSDSMMCSKNQVSRLTEPVYFSFAHKQNNKAFTLSLEATTSLYVAILEDTYTGVFTDLLASDYTFISTDAAKTQRFKLHFSQRSANRASAQYTKELMVWVKDNQLMYEGLDNLNGATVSVFSIGGKLISSGDIENPLFIEQKGVFVIQVRARNGETFNAKLIKR